jgi:hypothetical protein
MHMHATKTRIQNQPKQNAQLAHPQDAFTAVVMPAVERHAEIYFRHIKCRHRKADLVAEAVGMAWTWFCRMAERGKDGTQFPTAIASFAAKAANSGRRVVGEEKAKDVLSPIAQWRLGFAVLRLPDFSTLSASPLEEALHDNTLTPVDEQAAFRLDFAAWLATYDCRRRDMLVDMGLGLRAHEIADKYRVSGSRISQMRREAADNWLRFHGELV